MTQNARIARPGFRLRCYFIELRFRCLNSESTDIYLSESDLGIDYLIEFAFGDQEGSSVLIAFPELGGC
ncbi:hypothetical protein BV898_13115 [Hypsibius exemplaris]|uniref:Uncharacterized protein n=1 Tax=Hypsibius exemplaris TaxID=2072580 RepID=A0A1W0WBN1_HYPEX|nr:hypothetical protein BV898_13115 [Hypsibius exemplaris]